MRSVTVVRTGTANLASVRAALHRAGVEAEVTHDPDAVARAEVVVLPGVGAFGAARAELAGGLDEAIVTWLAAGRPFLAVCLGLQLLAASSEESPGVAGLGVIDAAVTRFAGVGRDGAAVRVPQLGWNRVTPTPGARLLQPGYAAFANSFKLDAVPAGWEGATAVHGAPFVAAIERGPQLACQFHPELSGPWGAALLARWLEAAC
jgi:imidazole glycerol phosphate synthase glutamine amidotransferase subunit